jgi:uncharacterized membrane protein YeaQ/YmgE (transglycosylase-associated protein family)
MGIIAWIILGLVAGMVAKQLVPGKDSHGLVITALIGVGGALLGGFAATQLFNIDGIQGFFNLATPRKTSAPRSLAPNMTARSWRSPAPGAGRPQCQFP